jgi:hypothetical protein
MRLEGVEQRGVGGDRLRRWAHRLRDPSAGEGFEHRGLLRDLTPLVDQHPPDEREEEPVAVLHPEVLDPDEAEDDADDDPSPRRDLEGNEAVPRDPPDHREQHPPTVERETGERVQTGEEQAEECQVAQDRRKHPVRRSGGDPETAAEDQRREGTGRRDHERRERSSFVRLGLRVATPEDEGDAVDRETERARGRGMRQLVQDDAPVEQRGVRE